MAATVEELLVAQLAESSGRKAMLADVVERFFCSYEENDIEARVALFADDLRFEDPAGTIRATDRLSLRSFYVELANRAYRLRFTSRNLVACSDSALVEAMVRVEIGNLGFSVIDLFMQFQVDQTGRIVLLRTFFDQDSIRTV